MNKWLFKGNSVLLRRETSLTPYIQVNYQFLITF